MASGFSNTTAKMLMASGKKFIWLGVMGAFMLVGWLAFHLADNAENPQTQLMGWPSTCWPTSRASSGRLSGCWPPLPLPNGRRGWSARAACS